jgi:iron complex outermembrane receptor protein
MKSFFIICYSIFLFPTLVLGQEVVSGIVVNRNGEPLIGVTIIEKGTENGTISGIDGTFTLLTSSDTLQISYIGYRQQELILNGQNKYRIVLIEKMILDYHDAPVEINAKYIISEAENTTTLTKKINEITIPGSTSDVLNIVPGLHMQSGGFNTNKLTIRGIGSTSQFATSDVKTFYNNIPLHNSIGESAIEDLGLHMADRIEIIKGTTGSDYEAGYGGAIIIKNKNIRSEEKTELTTNNTIGKWGHFTTQNQINLGRTDRKNSHNLSIYHSHVTDDGYRDNNQFTRGNLTLNYTMNRDGKLKLTGLFNHVDLKAFIPSSLNREDYDNEPSKAAFTWNKARGNEDYNRTLIGLNIDYAFDYKRSMSHTAYGQIFESSELRPFNTIDESADTYGVKGKFTYERPGYDEVYTVGYRLQNEGYDFQLFDTDVDSKGAQFGEGDEHRSIYELYTQLDAEISHKWAYKLGLNAQYVSISAEGSDVLDRAFILPEATFSYRLNSYNRLYVIVGRGVNYFSPQQALLPSGQYSQDLLPSSAWNVSLGGKGIIADHLEYRGEIYSMWATDLITIERDQTNQPINTNSGNAYYAGVELGLKYKLLRNIDQKNLNIEVNYNVMQNRYINFIDNEIDFSGNTIPGAPLQVFTTIISGVHQGWFANLRYQFVDAYQMRDDNSIQSESYQLVNALAGYRWNRGKWQISPRIHFVNLWDEKYAAMTLVNASSFGGNAPRHYYAGRPRHTLFSINIKYVI